MTNGASANTPPSAPSAMMPRRSSYASIVSGGQHNYQSPARAGAFSHLAASPSTNSHPPQYVPDHRYQRPTSGYDPDANASSLTAWRKSGQLPPFSRKFANLTGNTTTNLMALNPFFVPSYLKRSRYMQRLEAAYGAKLAAHRESASNHSSGLASLSTSASNANARTSHRGMVYDIVENALCDEDELAPLPSMWNTENRNSPLEALEEGTEIRYTGASGKNELDAICALADHPIPHQVGVYYFEVEIKSMNRDEVFAIGFCNTKASHTRLPGWEPETWAYHGDDGKSYYGEGTGKPYGPEFGAGDVIGCGIDFAGKSAFFTKNGKDLGVAFRGLRTPAVMPAVGLRKSNGAWFSANFGQKPFIFDIDGKIAARISDIEREIDETPTSTLRTTPPMDESTMVQKLVAQFFAHEGYIDTGKAFAQDIRRQNRPLQGEDSAARLEINDDLDAVNRQRIRAAILQGDIDKAIKHTTAHYPRVLEENPEIVFRLKCRKYVEMIRRCSELLYPPSPDPNSQLLHSRSTNGHTSVFGEEMDLDEDEDDEDEEEADDPDPNPDSQTSSHPSASPQHDSHTEWTDQNTNQTPPQSQSQSQSQSQPFHSVPTSTTTDPAPTTTASYDALLQEAMTYGQTLTREYRDEPPSWRRALEDIFSLIAYPDARGSVHGHLLETSGRIGVAEEVNSAILVSLGRSSAPALERVFQQTVAIVGELAETGGPTSLVNVWDVFGEDGES